MGAFSSAQALSVVPSRAAGALTTTAALVSSTALGFPENLTSAMSIAMDTGWKDHNFSASVTSTVIEVVQTTITVSLSTPLDSAAASMTEVDTPIDFAPTSMSEINLTAISNDKAVTIMNDPPGADQDTRSTEHITFGNGVPIPPKSKEPVEDYYSEVSTDSDLIYYATFMASSAPGFIGVIITTFKTRTKPGGTVIVSVPTTAPISANPTAMPTGTVDNTPNPTHGNPDCYYCHYPDHSAPGRKMGKPEVIATVLICTLVGVGFALLGTWWWFFYLKSAKYEEAKRSRAETAAYKEAIKQQENAAKLARYRARQKKKEAKKYDLPSIEQVRNGQVELVAWRY